MSAPPRRSSAFLRVSRPPTLVPANDSDRFLAVDTPDDYAHLITEHWPALQQAR